jgi:flagellar basal body-associated protein FliL
VLIPLAIIPVAALLIVIVIPILLTIVTIFWCFMYFSKKKYENATYYKYINNRFSSNKKKTADTNENPSEAVIDASYKTLEDENPR